ncbi:MAG TPA: LuxR C-terminal-related transcriptional regulator [Candidatus Sulfotelmatobacter sp.]|nr:LuxR C-terminal-related transcriptional regulator [Candidatus Sulfotelmatobacter sp.]
MAIRLLHRDFDACSRVLRELYASSSLQDFPDRLLPLVAGLVPSSHISYNDIDPGRNRIVIHYHPERADARKLVPQFAAHYRTHPLQDHYLNPGGIPKKVSDVVTLRQFKQTAIYQEYYREIGTKHQFICFFNRQNSSVTDDSFIGLALNRDVKDFSERDRSVLEFLSPHFTQAYQNARVASAMNVKLENIGEGLDAIHRAVILAGADGQIRWQSSQAREWLREFFPEERVAGRLPALLARWLDRLQKPSPGGLPFYSEFCGPRRGGSRLLIYCGRTCSGEYVLALIRERMTLDLAAAKTLDLTPREAEILFWISEGKTRPEMGAILGISWRTIAKHMEHLFAKLGVENRLEAQRIGLELRRI